MPDDPKRLVVPWRHDFEAADMNGLKFRVQARGRGDKRSLGTLRKASDKPEPSSQL